MKNSFLKLFIDTTRYGIFLYSSSLLLYQKLLLISGGNIELYGLV